MNEDTTVVKGFDYDHMVQEALRGVVRAALNQASKDGLHGAHHFYLTFQTNRSDVKIPDYLRDQHPEEITIVLQHQFWDLKTTAHGFAVSLSFNDIHETIEVPFGAMISFLDPSVKFGLQFIPDAAPLPEKKAKKARGNTAAAAESSGTDVPHEGAKVVALDAFRKNR